MATIKRFEEILGWQKARILTKEIYAVLAEVKDYGFRDQIQRAAVSVMSNIAEGFERGTKPELINYLYIAKGSAGEVRAQLYVAYDVGYIDEPTFQRLKNLAEECSKRIVVFTNGVKSSELKGLQHKSEMTGTQKRAAEMDAEIRAMLQKKGVPGWS